MVYREPTARSCLDYAKKRYRTSGYYQIKMDETGEVYHIVYCDMESEPGSAWTLVQSYALKNKETTEFAKTPLKYDAPVHSDTPSWNAYRMSHSQMSHLKQHSTHWRITCDFQSNPVDLRRDYALASFLDFDAMTFQRTGVCKMVKYINIRGHQCFDCTAAWWARYDNSGKSSIHVDSSRTSSGCQLDASAGSISNEDNFGGYGTINSNFRCTSSLDATTNVWFGGYF